MTVPMTWDDFVQTDEPVDQAEVHWWQVQGYVPRVAERRAVFHFNTRWEDFHDSGGRPGGAPFIHSWSFEEEGAGGRWRCTGRSERGWRSLKLNPEGEYATFPTREQAVDFAKQRCAARLANHEREAGELREALKALK